MESLRRQMDEEKKKREDYDREGRHQVPFVTFICLASCYLVNAGNGFNSIINREGLILSLVGSTYHLALTASCDDF